MVNRAIHRLFAITLAISVFTAMSVAPVAASDGIDIGGDDGVSIGTEGVSVGGDEGVEINASTDDGVEVGAGGDEGVEVSAGTDDGVEVGAGGDEGVEVSADRDDGVEVGAGGDKGVEVSVDTDDGVEADAAGQDVVEADTDGASVAGQDVGADGVESLPVAGTDGIEGVGGATDGVPSDIDGLASDEFGVETVPDELGATGGVDDSLPSEDLPVGGEDAPVNVCDTLDIEADDLPAESLPGLDDVPSEAAPSGVPTDLLTTRTLLAIATGIAPGPCEVVNPNDPPYDPVTGEDDIEPGYNEDVEYLGPNNGGVLGVVHYDVTLNESGEGPGISGVSVLSVNPEDGDIQQELAVNDGEKEYGVEPRLRYNEDRVWGDTTLVLLGKNLGAGADCERPEQYGGDIGDLQEDPLGPCEYKIIGLMNPPIGPAELIDIVLGATGDVGEEPLLPGEELPVNPDDLLNV